MINTRRHSREVALPSGSLAALRNAITREAGPLATIHALHEAGHQAGSTLYEVFQASLDAPPSSLGEGRFWTLLGTFLQQRGWGTLKHSSPHPGVGVLTSSDWAEAEGEGGEDQPGCSFSSGMLSGLLTEVAGGPVAVLQISCRSHGDGACTFAFGSEATIHDLYGLLLEGTAFEHALAEL
jgi:predicted hydrocarbon binding protein